MAASGAPWYRMVLSPAEMVIAEVRSMFEVPRAMIGSVLGTLAFCGLAVAAVLWAPSSEAADDEGPTLEFEPGALVRLGPKPEELPEKIVVEEKVAAPVVEDKEVVTEKETPPTEKKPPPKPKKDKKIISKEKPDPTKADAKEAERNQDSNTAHDDLPTLEELPGDPFGDPDGWSDLRKDGDPWATAVMAALNKLKYPAFGGKSGTGKFKFKMEICANGTVNKVLKKGSTGDANLDRLMMAEIERMKIPKAPPKLRKTMKRNCMFLQYNFAWDASGTVR